MAAARRRASSGTKDPPADDAGSGGSATDGRGHGDPKRSQIVFAWAAARGSLAVPKSDRSDPAHASRGWSALLLRHALTIASTAPAAAGAKVSAKTESEVTHA